MCGMSVVVALRGTSLDGSRSIATQLNESLERISHRGPDSRGTWVNDDQSVTMGHCRLAINDLSPDGHQPLHSSNGQIHAVVNGEIYDHDRLRVELNHQHGYVFREACDSELVVALYETFGMSFLSKLRGEFAFCIYDSSKQYFVAVRDRYGIKPLFWTVVGSRLLISVEAKGLLPLGWKPEWDVKSILEAGWNHDQRTLFKNVQKYWDLSYREKRKVDTRGEDEMISGVRNRLLESIRLRLRADVPVGIYLSGGIDSSAIAGIGHRRDTFDKESGLDESAIAGRTAEWLGVKHVKKHMDEQGLAQRFEDATYHCEHHNHDLNFVGKYALSEVPHEDNCKVVLTGEGADEQFAGYPFYIPDFLREPDLAWPCEEPIPGKQREELCTEFETQIAGSYLSIGADASNRGPSIARQQLNNITTPASMAAFQLQPRFFAHWTSGNSSATRFDTIANNVDGRVLDLIQNSWHPLHSALYVWTKGHLVNNFLSCLGDQTEMAHSIEARPPFLDHELAEYVNSLPPKAIKPFVTDEIYTKSKHPYTAPATWPAGGPLHQLLERLVTRSNVEQLGFLDWENVKGLVGTAFFKKDVASFRQALIIAEWIVISQRFGVERETYH
ncbi:asparagine synthetase [Diaporthe sp. PMI_573]|nr:asparagine synthetase [Diaporthaceae sp. PMI_573]